jgi:hypothetical protein
MAKNENSSSEVQGSELPGSTSLLSFWEQFEQSFAQVPDNIALICTHQPPLLHEIPSTPLDDHKYHENPYLRWRYRDLRKAVDQFTQGLQNRGVKKGK